MAYLYGGPSYLDVKTALSLGLPDSTRSASELELRDLTLQNFRPKDADIAAVSEMLGKPVPLLLGEEIFQRFAVQIDFSEHRMAFLDTTKVTKPKGAAELPLLEVDAERVVPLSVNDAQPAEFELELGNVSGPLLVSPAYAKEHRLLEGAKTSQRLSGHFTETVFALNHLGFANVQASAVPIAVIPESEAPPPSIAGGVGLPLLERFDILID